MSSGLAAVAQGFRGFARYFGGVLGADAYAKYLSTTGRRATARRH